MYLLVQSFSVYKTFYNDIKKCNKAVKIYVILTMQRVYQKVHVIVRMVVVSMSLFALTTIMFLKCGRDDLFEVLKKYVD